MGQNHDLDLTICDLLQGGDDVVRLANATSDADGAWDEISRWSRTKLTAALVAAIGALHGDEPDHMADRDGQRPHRTGRSMANQVTGRP